MPTRALHGLTVLHVGHFDPNVLTEPDHGQGAHPSRRDGRHAHRPSGVRAAHASVGPRSSGGYPADLVLVGFPGHSDVPLVRLRSIGGRRWCSTPSCRCWRRPRIARDRRCARRRPPATHWRTGLPVDSPRRCCSTPRRIPRTSPGVSACRSAKLRRVWVGADDDLVQPTPLPDTGFRVFVYASFIPLHGLEHVVRAAHLLERAGEPDPHRRSGRRCDRRRGPGAGAALGVTSVSFGGRRPFDEIVRSMARSHVCLGIFGTGPKAARVVPNKVFDALAAARPVVTADTPAAREALSDREHALLCPPGDPVALAAALGSCVTTPRCAERLAAQGYERFRQQFCIDAISADLTQIVLEHLDRRALTIRAEAPRRDRIGANE